MKHHHHPKFTKGITLLEILLVIGVAGMIVMAGSYEYMHYKAKTDQGRLRQNVNLLLNAMNGYYMQKCNEWIPPDLTKKVTKSVTIKTPYTELVKAGVLKNPKTIDNPFGSALEVSYQLVDATDAGMSVTGQKNNKAVRLTVTADFPKSFAAEAGAVNADSVSSTQVIKGSTQACKRDKFGNIINPQNCTQATVFVWQRTPFLEQHGQEYRQGLQPLKAQLSAYTHSRDVQGKACPINIYVNASDTRQ